MRKTANLLTFEQFERLPDKPGKSELLDAELIQSLPATLRHMDLAQNLFLLLLEFVKSEALPHLGQVNIEYGYKLGTRSWLQPDVSIAYSNQARGRYLEGAPL